MAAKELIYRQDSAFVVIEEGRPKGSLSFLLILEAMRDEATSEILVRCPAFPAQIGCGKTLEEAQKALLTVHREHVAGFLELNGMARFKTRLLEMGFELVTREEMLPSSAQNRWQRVPPVQSVQYQYSLAS